jgi:hypothetical protein
LAWNMQRKNARHRKQVSVLANTDPLHWRFSRSEVIHQCLRADKREAWSSATGALATTVREGESYWTRMSVLVDSQNSVSAWSMASAILAWAAYRMLVGFDERSARSVTSHGRSALAGPSGMGREPSTAAA